MIRKQYVVPQVEDLCLMAEDGLLAQSATGENSVPGNGLWDDRRASVRGLRQGSGRKVRGRFVQHHHHRGDGKCRYQSRSGRRW